MPKINILPKHLAELIAAGEVVERPASAVKELMENSIDAGADKITVEIKNGGIRYIRITDNGCGIAREDIRAAFISHATSKISTSEELEAIFTLGFRGEALASVAAVSTVEVLTKTADEEIGTRYKISAGEEIFVDDAGCPVGTTLMIHDLFFNTPARMKFLKKDTTEGNYISDVVSKIALSHPEISITFIKDNKRALFTSGDGNPLSVISEIYGREAACSLIELSGVSDGVRVSGYISKPVYSRANRSMQHCFVNGRYVKLPVVSSALDNAYKNQIMTGKYPACVLFFEVEPRTVDVNVHPAKTQIRFADERPVYDAVYFASVAALKEKDTPIQVTPVIKSRFSADYQRSQPEQMNMMSGSLHLSVTHDEYFEKESASAEKFSSLQDKKEAETEDTYTRIDKKDTKEEVLLNVAGHLTDKFGMYEVKQPESSFYKLNDSDELDILLNNPTKKEAAVPLKADDSENKEKISKDDEFKVIGEVFNTYILIEKDSELIFIDKHAAHERIIFNQLKNRDRRIYSQLLAFPVTVSLSARDYAAILGNLDIFEKSGYSVDDFGEGTVRVTECPTELANEDIVQIITEMADKLASHSSDPEPEKLSRLYYSTACRAAVKAGDSVSELEARELALKALTDDEVRYCPHGRPVMFKMSENEIKRLFGRNG